MTQDTLQSYLAKELDRNTSKAHIKDQLLAVGWTEEEADRAYAEALIARGVPVPEVGGRTRATAHVSTVEIVINFFSFILLGIVVSALGSLYFEVIGKYFPDPLTLSYGGGFSADSVHYAIAALVIALPLYVVVVRLYFKRFREDEQKVESRLTKWLTYLVLLVAAVTIVGDLIYSLFTFLQGEITVRFFLKALTILVLAGMTFGFYYLERKRIQYGQDIPRSVFQRFGWTLGGVALVGVVLGFLAAGSPSTAREQSFDQQRSQDLQELAGCIDGYAQQYQTLPASLADLNKSTRYSYCSTLADPETNTPYRYTVVTPLAQGGVGTLAGEFELCATFALPSAASAKQTVPAYYGDTSKWFDHPAGLSCDNETVTVKLPSGTAPLPSTTVTPPPQAVPVPAAEPQLNQ